jgi:DNA-binding MarR family transcriptional regulator
MDGADYLPDHVNAVADALIASVALLGRRVGEPPTEGELTMPEHSALSRLDRCGPATSAQLARAARISPQAMGATLAALTERGLVRRDRDPGDGRRVVLSVTREGLEALGSKRSTRSQQLAAALAGEFTSAELKRLMAAAPLIERLAHSV